MAAPTVYDNSADKGARRAAARTSKTARPSSQHEERQERQSPSREKANYDSYRDMDEPRTPTSELDYHEAMHRQHRATHVSSQSRNGDHSKPPVSRRGPPQGAVPPTAASSSPSFSGPPEEGSPTRSGATRNGQSKRQSRRLSGSEPSLPPSSRPDGSPSRQLAPTQNRRSGVPDQQLRSGHASASAPQINRLDSPSIGKSVLQPLEHKINEYQRLMSETQSEMARMDEELRALQERRLNAEDRFLEAKSKHDEYERQYDDVGRALRGEAPRPITPHAAFAQPPFSPVRKMPSLEKRPPSMRSSVTHKLTARERIRMTLFGSP